jgi:hypothetical protein
MTEPAQTPPSPHATEIRAIVDAWFNTHIAGSPISRSVEAYNHLRTVLGHLETGIVAATGGRNCETQTAASGGAEKDI